MESKNMISASDRELPINRRMWRSKRGVMAIVTPILVIVAIVGLGFFAAKGLGWIPEKQEPKPLAIAQGDIAVNPVTHNVTITNCGANKDTAYDLVAYNPLDEDGTATYPAVGFKAKDSRGGALKSYTTDTDGTFAGSSLGLNCPAHYDIYAPASKNTTASAHFTMDTATPNDDDQVAVEQLDHITVYAYDNINKGFVYDDSDASATDGEELVDTTTFKSTTNNATAYAMGTGTHLDWTFTVYTGATQRSWGDLKNYVIVDADKSDFAPVSLYLDGKGLSPIDRAKSSLNDNDKGYLSAYEYVAELDEDIIESLKNLQLKATPKSGQNPDVDIKVRFVSESYYVDGTEIKRGIFDAGGNEVLMAPAQEIVIDVS